MKKMMKNRPGLLDDAQRVAGAGRNGDKILAHITPEEAEILKARGGSGTVNPKTGILEFWEGDPDGGNGGASGGGTADAGNGGGGGGGTSDPMGTGTDYGVQNDGLNPSTQGTGTPGFQGEAQIADDALAGAKFSPSFMSDPFGYLGDMARSKISDIRDNPAAFGLNTAFGLIGGPLGMMNSIAGLAGMPTVGSMATGAARSMTGYGEPTGMSAGNQPGGQPSDTAPGNGSEGTAGINPNTGAPYQMPQQTPQQVAQQALQRALIYKPQAYNQWQGNHLMIPGILG